MAGGVTILVKKADGTSVRMSLDEIKKMKETKTVEVKKEIEKVVDVKPAVTKINEATASGELSTVKSVGIIDKLRDSSPPAQNDVVLPRHSERSEESLGNLDKQRDPSPSAQDDVAFAVKKIIKDSGVNIPAEITSRANSLVTSRLKGIRDDDQFLASAIKSGANGGLNLNQAQAERILNFIRDYLKKNTVKIAKPSSMPMSKQSYRRPSGMLPMKDTFSHELSNTTPVTDIFLDEAKAMSKKINTPPSPAPAVKPAIKDIIKLPADYDFIHRMTAKSIQKKGELIQDISPGQKPEEEKFTGPADEMKKFNLRDWRRLAHKPTECAEIILHKFEGWKEESYLLYMDCKQAWSQSPLLTEYRNILLQSINTGTTVQNIIKNLHNKDSLLYEEFLELGRLNARLEM